MGRTVKYKETNIKSSDIKPSFSSEAQENHCISLAVNLAEKQLAEGTASSQVITHYLKLGTKKEQIELEILQKQKELIEAKTESLKSAKKMEELYTEALKSMREYSGNNVEEDE